MFQVTIYTLRSPIVLVSVLMRTWSVRSSGRLVKLVSSSSGITCGVPTLGTSKSIIAGIHVTNGCLVSMATRVSSGSREAWMFPNVQMTSRSVSVSCIFVSVASVDDQSIVTSVMSLII